MSIAEAATAIVIGASATGLQVVRDLGRRGRRVLIADTDADKPGCFSRFLAGPPLIAPTLAELLPLLRDATAQHGRCVLVPASDLAVDFLIEHREPLAAFATPVSTFTADTAGVFLDKRRFAELCKRAGVPSPRLVEVSETTDLVATVEGFSFPLLLKPSVGHLWRDRLSGRKLIVAESPADLTATRERFGDLTGLMIQELIPGDEDNLWVSAMRVTPDGQTPQQFVGRKLRQHPLDYGSASWAESRSNDEVAELSRRLAAASGFAGLMSTEFKYDARDGRYQAIEVNPRPSLWWGLVAASGVPLVEDGCRQAMGEPVGEASEQQDGCRWLFAEKDLIAVLRQQPTSRMPRRLLSYFGQLATATSRPIWSRDDRRPTAALLRYYLKRALRR